MRPVVKSNWKSMNFSQQNRAAMAAMLLFLVSNPSWHVNGHGQVFSCTSFDDLPSGRAIGLSTSAESTTYSDTPACPPIFGGLHQLLSACFPDDLDLSSLGNSNETYCSKKNESLFLLNGHCTIGNTVAEGLTQMLLQYTHLARDNRDSSRYGFDVAFSCYAWSNFFVFPDASDCEIAVSALNAALSAFDAGDFTNCEITTQSSTQTSTATSTVSTSATTTESTTATTSQSTTQTSTYSSTATTSLSSTATSSVTSTASTTITSTVSSTKSSTVSSTGSSTVTSTQTTTFTTTATSSETSTVSSTQSSTVSTSLSTTITSTATFTATTSMTSTESSTVSTTVSSTGSTTISSSATSTGSSTVTSTASSTASTTLSSSQSSTATTTATTTVTSSISTTATSSMSSTITTTVSTTATSTKTTSQTSTVSTTVSTTQTSTVSTTGSSTVTTTVTTTGTSSASSSASTTVSTTLTTTASTTASTTVSSTVSTTLTSTQSTTWSTTATTTLTTTASTTASTTVSSTPSTTMTSSISSTASTTISTTISSTVSSTVSTTPTSTATTSRSSTVTSSQSSTITSTGSSTVSSTASSTVTTTVTTRFYGRFACSLGPTSVYPAFLSVSDTNGCSEQLGFLQQLLQTCAGLLPVEFSVQCLPSTVVGMSRISIGMPQSQGCWISGARAPEMVTALNSMIHTYTTGGAASYLNASAGSASNTSEHLLVCAPDGTLLFSSRTACSSTVDIINNAVDDFLEDGPFRDCTNTPTRTTMSSTITRSQTPQKQPSFIEVHGAVQIVKEPGRSAVVPVRMSYHSGMYGLSTVSVIVSVKHPNPVYAGVYTSAVLATTGADLRLLPLSANDVVVNVTIGSWAKPSDDYVIQLHLTTEGWRERFDSSNSAPLAILQEHVHISSAPQTLIKSHGKSVKFAIDVTYFTTQFSKVDLILLVRDSHGRGGYVTGAALANSSTQTSLRNLPSQGSIRILGTLGSWTPVASQYDITVVASAPGQNWRGRFLWSQTVPMTVAAEFVRVVGIDSIRTTTIGREGVNATLLVTKRPGAAIALPVAFEYAAATLGNISIITAVRRLEQPGRNYVFQPVLPSMYPKGATQDTRLHVGSWLPPDQHYQILFSLAPMDQGWRDRFVTSPGFPFYVQSEFVQVTNVASSIAVGAPTTLRFTVRYAAEAGTAVTIIPRVMQGARKFVRRSYRVDGSNSSLEGLASSGVVSVAVELGSWAVPSGASSPYDLVVQLTRGSWRTRLATSEAHYFHIQGR
eukprot:m.10710 g.10710  ORF g.10710 m.10710 type:complete len:1262 (+) comp7808_c0_seq1:274-4059(+)